MIIQSIFAHIYCESLPLSLDVRCKITNLENTGCPKINETHKIANKYVDFNPIVYIFQI